MSLQEKMFSAVEMWLASGISKLDFLAGKEYSVAKFNYWLAKWKASQANETAGVIYGDWVDLNYFLYFQPVQFKGILHGHV
jgi:hypothetical protein